MNSITQARRALETQRKAYSLEQLRACLFVAELRYDLAGSCFGAAMWLKSQHALRDRIAMAEALARVSK